MFFHTRHRYNTRFLLLNYPLFSHWCFTHQYKNTTQFCFYAGLAATQNTNQKKGVIYSDNIETLSSPTQLKHSGFYRFAACSANVNSQLDSDSIKFTDYTAGDFYALLFAYQTSTSGCRFGTFIVTSPRFIGTFWTGRIWDYKFTGWFKFSVA